MKKGFDNKKYLKLQTEKIFKVMKMDMDYWDSMDDDKQSDECILH